MLKYVARDYQQDAAEALIDGFFQKQDGEGPFARQLIVEPTGAGKTFIFAILADFWVSQQQKPVLVLVDQIDLADQARDELMAATDLFPQIEQGDRRASAQAPVVIASVQSMANRLADYDPTRFGLVIADEADRSVSDQWQKVLKHFDGTAKVAGVTATPDRADQRNVMDYYERIAHETPLFELIKRGYLAKIMVQTCPISIDISKVRQVNGDYDKEELDRVLTPCFGEVCEAIKQHASARKILVFLPLITTSLKFAEVARDHDLHALHIDGASPDRDNIKERFRRREIDILSNAMLLGRGYNDRSIDCIINLRPTRSASLYRQFVGRGTRTYCPHGCNERCEHREAKQDLLLLDFLWQFHRLGLQRPANLVAQSAEHAKKLTDYSIRQSGKVLDLEGIDSKVAIEAEKALLKQLQKNARNRPGFFNAMEFAITMQQRDLIDYQPRAKWESKPMTEKQGAYLEKLGFDSTCVESFGQAHAILDAVAKRRDAGLATLKQVKLLRKYGVPHAEKVTFEGALKWLNWRLHGQPLPDGYDIYKTDPESKGDKDKTLDMPVTAESTVDKVNDMIDEARAERARPGPIYNPEATTKPDFKAKFAEMKRAVQGDLQL